MLCESSFGPSSGEKQQPPYTEEHGGDAKAAPSSVLPVGRVAGPARAALRVLVAEDDADLRNLLVEAIEAEGYEVVVACDGAEALEKARACRPDVALLDQMMPRLEGAEVVRRMREDPALRVIPVILMTAAPYSVPRDVAGLVPVTPKPFDLDRLLATLADVARAR